MKRPASLLGLEITFDSDSSTSSLERRYNEVEEAAAKGLSWQSDGSDVDVASNGNDDDDEGLLRRAFFVDGELPPEAGPPQNGVDFLRHVRWESRRIPNTIVANDKVIESRRKPRQSSNGGRFAAAVKRSRIATECVNGAKPSAAWESHFLAWFGELRSSSSVEALAAERAKQKRMELELPAVNDACGWVEFCLERHPTAPCSVFNAMDNVRVSKAIEALSGEVLCKEPEREAVIHRWLFFLFVRVEQPLLAETAAGVRGVLKLCCEARSRVTEDECRLNPNRVGRLNILITICAKYFGQM